MCINAILGADVALDRSRHGPPKDQLFRGPVVDVVEEGAMSAAPA